MRGGCLIGQDERDVAEKRRLTCKSAVCGECGESAPFGEPGISLAKGVPTFGTGVHGCRIPNVALVLSCCPALRVLASGEGLLQVGNKLVGTLDAHRQAEKIIRHGAQWPLDRRPVLDQALYAA